MVERADSAIILSWTLIGISTVIVTLRLWVRTFWLRRVRAEDYFMLLALMTELAHAALCSVARHHGYGEHIWTLSPQQTVQTMKYVTIQAALAITTPMWGRISFALFLIHLLGPTAWIKRGILWSVIGVQAVVSTIIVIQIYAQCGTHPTAIWNPEVRKVAHCQSPEVQLYMGFVQSEIALNSLCDLVLTVIPAIIVWNMTVPRKTKVALAAVLTLSVFALGASIWKSVEIRNLGNHRDFTWNIVALQISITIENNVVMIAASMPTLSPLWRKRLRPHQYVYDASGTVISDGQLSPRVDAHHGIWQGSKHSFHEANVALEDGTSEEYFLQELQEGIVKTTNVHVAYVGTSESSRSQRELYHAQLATGESD